MAAGRFGWWRSLYDGHRLLMAFCVGMMFGEVAPGRAVPILAVGSILIVASVFCLGSKEQE